MPRSDRAETQALGQLEPGCDRNDEGPHEDQHPTEGSNAERSPAELLHQFPDSCYLGAQPRLDVRHYRPVLSKVSVDPLPHLVEFLAERDELTPMTVESLFNARALGWSNTNTSRATRNREAGASHLDYDRPPASNAQAISNRCGEPASVVERSPDPGAQSQESFRLAYLDEEHSDAYELEDAPHGQPDPRPGAHGPEMASMVKPKLFRAASPELGPSLRARAGFGLQRRPPRVAPVGRSIQSLSFASQGHA